MESSNINILIEGKQLNEAMQTWTGVIQQALDQHAPMKEMKPRKRKSPKLPWMTTELEEKKAEKNMRLQLYYMQNDPKDKEKAKKLNNEITHEKEKLKKEYYSCKLEECEGDS